MHSSNGTLVSCARRFGLFERDTFVFENESEIAALVLSTALAAGWSERITYR